MHGTVSTIATNIGAKLQSYNALPTTVVFDRYGNVSAKDHERERRAIGVCAGTYNVTLTSPLPNREVIMKSKANKILLSFLLCTCMLALNMFSFMIDAVRDGRRPYASSVTTQTSSSFSFSGCGN